MGLEDFERELAQSKEKENHRKRERSRSPDRDQRRRKHHHRSSRHHKDREDEDQQHKHSRSRHSRHGRSHRSERQEEKGTKPSPLDSPAVEEDEDDEWIEKEAMVPPTTEETLDKQLEDATESDLKRDSWMEAPSTLDVDYVQRRREAEKPTKARATRDDYELRIHKNELNHHLRDIQKDTVEEAIADEPAQHEVDYEFGDAGSAWRMTKLKAVYRQAEESGWPVEEVALERYGDLRDFDDAREEEIELDRRKMYGKDYVGKIKPSGELFQERKLNMGIRRVSRSHLDEKEAPPPRQGAIMDEKSPPARTVPLDQTALNKLKAQMMKAKLRGASDAAELEAKYNLAMSEAANRREPEVVVLGAMENRMLAGGRKGEVKAIQNTRGRERGIVEENEDMSIEDMVRQERRTRGQAGGDGLVFAERIAKDVKFDVSCRTLSSMCLADFICRMTWNTWTTTQQSSPNESKNPRLISATQPLATFRR